jgi:uncharacterized protein YukE
MADAKIVLTAEDKTRAVFDQARARLLTMQDNVGKLNESFGKLGLVLGAAFAGVTATQFFKNTVEGVSALNDLSAATGSSVEKISALEDVAARGGGSIETVSTALLKFNKVLLDAAQGSTNSNIFTMLGLSAKRLKDEDPAEALREVAVQLAQYQDDGNKARIVQELFGRSTRDVAKFLRDLAEAGDLNAKVTSRQAAESEKFDDMLASMKKNSTDLARAITGPGVEAFNNLAEAMSNAAEKSTLLQTAIGGSLKTIIETFGVVGNDTVYVFKQTGEEIGSIAAQLAALGRGDLAAFKAIRQERVAAAQQARDEIDEIDARILGATKRANALFNDTRFEAARKQKAPDIDKAKAGTDPAKRLLEQQLRAIRDGAKEQADAYAFTNELLRGVYSDGVLEVQSYYDSLAAVRRAGLSSQVEAIDKEISVLKAYKPAKPEDEIDRQTKIAEAQSRRSLAVQNANQAEALSAFALQRELKALSDRYVDLQANMLQMSGDESGAAFLRIARQTLEAQKLVTQLGVDPAIVTRYNELLTLNEKFRQIKDDLARNTDKQRNAEELLQISVDAGNKTETQGLIDLGRIRQANIQQLGEMLAKATELANELNTPETLAFADALRVQFAKASAEMDPLLKKTQELAKSMGDAFADAFERAVIGGESFSASLKGLEKQLLQIAYKELVGNPLKDLFSGFFKQFTAGTGTSGNASGGAGFLGNIFKWFAGGFAEGGYVPPGHWAVAGERGPEPIYGGRTGVTVQPNGGGSMTLHINQHFSGPVDGRTMQQVAASTAHAVQAASMRLN